MFQPPYDLTALGPALAELKETDRRVASVFELRFFEGFSVEETAEQLGVSRATVKRDWSFAKAFLFRRLQPS